MPASKKATSTDRYIGIAMRFRRKELGLSQADLAKALGVAYQQVQKYEEGSTRISASRLTEIAKHLREPVSYFLQPMNDADKSANTSKLESRTLELLRHPGGAALLWHYSKIKDPAHRKRVLELARSLAADEEDT